MPAPSSSTEQPSNVLGRGRSAVVRLDGSYEGLACVRKVFVGDTLSRLVHEFVSGAPNPYTWSRDAAHAGALRRRILEHLVPYWFGTGLRLPRTFDLAWAPTERCWSLRMERIHGRHLPLRGPLSHPDADPLPGLLADVERPLAERLEAWGFVGLVWQAGRGNPVAVGNFMLERLPDGRERWVWIDLESGVPALFSLSPRAWWTFYLPWMARLRRPLFDDVVIPRLRHRVNAERDTLAAAGVPVDGMAAWIDELASVQHRWKSRRRIERTLLAEVARGRITPQRAGDLRRHPLRALGWLAGRAVRSIAGGAMRIVRRVGGWLTGFDYLGAVRAVGRFTISQRYRAQLARTYLERRVDRWRERGSLTQEEHDRLIRDLEQDETSEYVTDFGVHLLVKPFVKFLQWIVLPLLYVLGVAPEATVILLIIGGGAIVRTAYTLVRFLQALLRGQRLPWTALGIGLLPTVGNAAWPAELIVSSVGEDRVLARFLLQDVFAAFGRSIPIWGGRDTLTEHWLNRLPDRLWHRRRKLPLPQHGVEGADQRARGSTSSR